MPDKRAAGRREPDVLKGVAAGVVAGLAAAWAMNQFQALWSRIAQGEERSHGAQSMQQGSPSVGAGRELRERGLENSDDDATERLASIVSEKVFDRELTERQKAAAGTLIHYGFGLTGGALYGALAEIVPQVTAWAGLPYGAAIWATADEGLVPALGLSKSAAEYPPSIHAYSLASHLVFGLATEAVRRALRDAL